MLVGLSPSLDTRAAEALSFSATDPPEIVEGLVASPKCGGDVEIDLDMLIRVGGADAKRSF